MRLLLDTGILGQLCHPNTPKNKQTAEWLDEVMKYPDEVEVIIPEICDYELRRKLIHLIAKGQAAPSSLDRLNDLGKMLTYLPLDTETMQQAADLWADSRLRGLPTAAESSLDGDVILAAQASGVNGMIVTNNRKHLQQFVAANDWREFPIKAVFTCMSGPAEQILIEDPRFFSLQDAAGRNWFCIRQDFKVADLDSGAIVIQYDPNPVQEFYETILNLGVHEFQGTTFTKYVTHEYPLAVSDDYAILKLKQELDKT